MNAIRSYFTAAAVAFLVVAIGGRVASSADIWPVWKCCPADRVYDPITRFCIPAYDDDEFQQLMLNRLRRGFRVADHAVLESSSYKPPYCDSTEVLVDVPTAEVRGLMREHRPSSAVGLPPGYCFDLTPSDELVARTCRPRDQYCGRPGYTCVKKCCGAEQMYVKDRKSKYNSRVTCIKNEMPFAMSAYKTVVAGNPVGRSNNTVLPYYVGHSCYDTQIMDGRVTLTTDGNFLLTDKGDVWLIDDPKYCLEYYAEDGQPEAVDLRAVLCYSNTKPPVSLVFWVTYPLSVVCLVLTLIVYATLPYLRNTHGYYVMFYMICRLVYIVCLMTISLTQDDIDSPLCVPFGYFTFFAILTTFCWLNVICFDIYWMLRYNNSINRNTSTSARTIKYHIYCWGFSSILVSTGYLFKHSQHETLMELAPDIGDISCFFYDQNSYGTLIFYWLPTCGMMTANLVLFLLTAIHCSRIKSELNKFKQTDSKTEMFLFYKEKFVMSIKLYLIMGIPFLFSKLSVIFKIEGIIMDIMRVINGLHGVFIFIIFVAKRKIIMDLWKKFRRPMVHIELTPINNITGSS